MSDLARRIANLSSEQRQLLEQQLLRRLGDSSQRDTIPARSGGAGQVPVSYAQERLWFLDQLEPGSPVYNVPVAIQLVGSLNTAALVRSLREIVRRHAALRTTFECVDGRPVQQIAPALDLDVPVADLSGLPPDERETEARRLVDEETHRPFDLRRGPLARAQLVRLGDQEHWLVLVMHHIVSDGWSMGVLYRELGALYAAFSAGQESPLPELPIQYADYAVWQRQWLQGRVLEEQRAYWARQLAGAPEPLELPLDRPRPRRRSSRGGTRSVLLPLSLREGLQALGQKERTTLFMTLLAAFQALLHRYSGAADLLIGTPIANRQQSEVENLIGFFANTLVLRAAVEGDLTFRELLARAKETALDAYARQDLPFEKLVEELHPERDSGRTPLFDVMFVLQNTPARSLELPGLTLRRLEARTRTAKFDLTLMMEEQPAGLRAAIHYNTDLFDETTIARMLGHLQVLLEGIVRDPDQRIAELPLLTPAERQQLLVEWNDTRCDYPREACIHELFEAQAAQTPGAVAILFGEQSLTYRELDRRADLLARRLQRMGVGPGAFVALWVERSVEMVVAVLAILKAGGAYLPLDTADPPDRLAFLLADTKAALVLTDGRCGNGLPEVSVSRLRLDSDDVSESSAEERRPAPSGVTPDSLAYVAYTSGSTGLPKGVCVPHRAVVRLVKGADYARLSAEETFLQLAPLAFDAATFEIWGCLLNGGRLVIFPPHPPSLSDLEAVVQHRGVTTLWLTAGLFHQMVEHQLSGLKGVRQLLAGGDVLSAPHVRKVLEELPGCRLINGYGPTEGTTFTCCYPVPPDWSGESSVPIGRPIANTQVYVLDQRRQLAPVGVPGELYIGGDGLATGYLNRPELTAERFVDSGFWVLDFGLSSDQTPIQSPARLYRTGDRVRWRPDGTLEFLGRMDHQVKIRGYRVELGEIEACLRDCPLLQEAVVVTREDRSGERQLAAYVVPQPDETPTAADLRRFLQERLPHYMLPSAFVLLPALPLNANGKVDRLSLPDPHSAARAGARSEAPRSGVEGALLEICSELLEAPALGIHDDFFEAGGHSLLATQVISRARALMQAEIPLRWLFESPTVAELAARIETELLRQEQLPERPILPVSAQGELPLSFAQERLWFLDRFQPNSPVYNVPIALHLHGPLDRGALEQALREIVTRHEVLRTRFPAVEGSPVQIIAPQADLTLTVESLPAARKGGEAVGGAIPAEARAWIQQEAEKPFDLATGPLLRASLLRLGPDEHVLLLCMHHIAADGWSVGILFHEMEALYRAFAQGDPSPLEPLPIQYAAFATWQRQWLQGEPLEKQLTYWKRQLDGLPPALALATDHPRPPIQTTRGARMRFELSPDLSGRLRALGQREGTTLFMTLLAAFEALLFHLSGQTDLVVGTPIANRNRLEIERLIGFFVNTLVLRTDLAGDPTFRELLQRVREAALGAYLHQDLPFEKLVEELRPPRDPSRSPLFQVMFVLQNTATPDLEIPGLSVQPLEVGYHTAKFDLSLQMQETEDRLRGSIAYNTDLFEPETIDRIISQFQDLLERVATDPEQCLSALQPSAPLRGDAVERSALPASDSPEPGRTSEPTAPRDAQEAALLELWEEVLGVGPIGIRDNFFERGGHSLMAVRLFALIEKRIGKALPLTTLFQAPTVEQFAILLRQEGWAPSWRSLVPIQPSGSRPPLFCVHAVGGHVLSFEALVRNLPPDQPVYGLQAQGLDGSQPEAVSIEEMAARYIREIRAVQPEGPYHLGGSSFGGTVAYEMACQLLDGGHAVGLVALFDSHAPVTPRRWGLLRRIPGHWREIQRLDRHERLRYIAARGRGLWKRIRVMRWRLAYRRHRRLERPVPPHLLQVERLNLEALRSYVPRSYPGRVVLFRALKRSVEANPDPVMGWDRLAQGGVEIHDVPGDHNSVLMDPNVRAIAERIAGYLSR